MKYINNGRSARSFSLKILSIVVKSFYGLGWVIAIGLFFNQEPPVISSAGPELSTVCVVTVDVPAGQTLSPDIVEAEQILTRSVSADMVESCEQVNFSQPIVLNAAANSAVKTAWFAPKESLNASMHEAIAQDKTVITMLASDFHVLPSELSAHQEITILKANKQANSAVPIVNHASVLAVQPLSEKDALITFSVQSTESIALAQSLGAGDQLHLIYSPKHATPTPKAKKI
jgi:hypothetical protein